MPDPFSFPDPFAQIDPFSSYGGGGRRRQAAFPPLSDADTDAGIQSLTGKALSGLGYVGSELDKLFGGRAVRGALAGKPGELLSLIPGSDVVGLTDAKDTVTGEDLLKGWGYDPSKGNWLERNLAGPAVEIGLDPSTYLGGIGALTKAGKIASKTGALTKGFIPSIAAGERTLMHGFTGPGTAAFAQGAADLGGSAAQALNVGVRKLPVVGPLAGAGIDLAGAGAKRANLVRKSLFDTNAGPVANQVVQDSFGGVKVPNQEAADVASLTKSFDLDQRRQAIIAAGANPRSVDRLMRQLGEGVQPKWVDPTMGPHMADLQSLAADTAEYGGPVPRAAELARGLPSPELDDPHVDYLLRQWTGAGGGGNKARQKLLPTGSPSVIRRKEAIRNHPGGTIGIEDYGVPEMAGAARTLPDREVSKRILGDLLEPYGPLGPGNIPLAPAAVREEMKRAASLGRMLKGVDPSHVADATGARVPFFEPDVIKAAELRNARANASTSSADAVYDVIKKAHGLARGAETDVPVRKVLSGAGLTGEPAMGLAARAVGLDPDALVAAATQIPMVPPSAADVLGPALDAFRLPAAEARGATKLLNRWQVPEEWKPVLGAFDAFNRKFRDLSYTVWPASWGRNMGSGVAENALEGTSPFNAAYRDVDALRGGKGVNVGVPSIAGTPGEQAVGLRREMYAHGVGGRGQGQAGAVAGAPSAGFTAPQPSILSMLPGYFKAPIETGKKVSQAVEERLRMSQFLDLRRKGYDAKTAAAEVLANHFDYTKSTDFENAVMKRLVPFYTFPSRNLPKQVRRAVQSPAKVSAPIRLSGGTNPDDEGYVPEYLQNGLALPVGANADGTQRYLSQLGLPMEEAFSRLKIGDGLTGTVQKTGQGLLGTLGPAVKAPLEYLTGKQFYTGRDMADLHVGKLESLGGILDEDSARLLAQLVANSPGTRMVSTANRLLDERKYTPTGLAAIGLGLTTGARLTDVDTQKWRAIDARHNLEELMRGQTGIRQSTDFYPTPQAKAEGSLTPEQQYELRLYAGMKLRAREAAAQKRVGVQMRP